MARCLVHFLVTSPSGYFSLSVCCSTLLHCGHPTGTCVRNFAPFLHYPPSYPSPKALALFFPSLSIVTHGSVGLPRVADSIVIMSSPHGHRPRFSRTLKRKEMAPKKEVPKPQGLPYASVLKGYSYFFFLLPYGFIAGLVDRKNANC